jgi:hypothetical protein
LKNQYRLKTACVLLSAAMFTASSVLADVTGKVTLEGTPPEMKVLDMSAQKECASLHPDPVTEETVIVGDKGELKNVVVSLKKDEDKDIAGDVPKTPAVLDQKDCMYSPHVVAMMVGQGLVVKNSDPFLHNVHGKPSINNEFNVPMPHKNDGEKINPQPKAPEYINVKCDVHPWMSAWVAVFDHPYFSVTGDDGTFDIKNLPDGEYTLQAWHEAYGTKEQKVTVKGGKAEVNFTFKTDDAPAKGAPANAADKKKVVMIKTATVTGVVACPLCREKAQ